MTQDDEEKASWDPKVAMQAGDYGEDGSAVLGVASLQMAEVLGLDTAVRKHQHCPSSSSTSVTRCHCSIT